MTIDTKRLRELALNGNGTASPYVPLLCSELLALLDDNERLRAAIETSQLVKDHDALATRVAQDALDLNAAHAETFRLLATNADLQRQAEERTAEREADRAEIKAMRESLIHACGLVDARRDNARQIWAIRETANWLGARFTHERVQEKYESFKSEQEQQLSSQTRRAEALEGERDALRAQLNHAISENLAFNIKVSEEINELRTKLFDVARARDEACEIALQWAAHLRDLHGDPQDRSRISALRSVGEVKGGGE